MTDLSAHYSHESTDVETGRRPEQAVAKAAFASAGTDSSTTKDSHGAGQGIPVGTTSSTTKNPTPRSPSTGMVGLGLASYVSGMLKERVKGITTADEETDTNTTADSSLVATHVAAPSDSKGLSGTSMTHNDKSNKNNKNNNNEAGMFTDLEAGACKMPGQSTTLSTDGVLENDSHSRRSRKESQANESSQRKLDVSHKSITSSRYDSDDADDADYSEDDDDDSVSSLESADGDGGIIAIGLPQQDKKPVDKKPPAATRKPPVAITTEEATQQVLSEVVAQNMAEEEHNLKIGQKTSPPVTGVEKRRSSTRNTPSLTSGAAAREVPPPPTVSSSSSHDGQLLSSSSSSGRLVREPTSTAGAAMDMNERRLARANARASRQNLGDTTSTDEDSKKGSRARVYSSDESVKRLPRMRNKSFDSTSSGDSAYTFATENMRVRASRRSRDEANKMKEHESGPSLAPATTFERGPSLAPATSFDREISAPGAFSARQERNSKEDTGPSLAPATSSAIVPAGPMLSTPTPMAASAAVAACEEEEEEEEMEAQAGIPVAYPGAFAIEGLDSGHGRSGYDSSADETSSLSSTFEQEHGQEVATAERAPEDYMEAIEVSAIEAQLHVVVDGAILIPQNEDDLLSDPKVVRRLRMIQSSVLCFSIAAAAMVAASIVGGFSTGNGPNFSIPTIEGWIPVGSELQGPTEDPKVKFGTSVAISGDGEWIAITAPGVNNLSATPPGLNVGQVHVLKAGQGFNGTEWFPSTILKGPGPSLSEKASLAMSDDGKRLAVGYYESEAGVVQLFERDVESDSFSGDATEFVGNVDTWYGHSVDLSADGSIFAIGAPRTDTVNGIRSGVVRIFQNIDSTWTQLGQDIQGKAENEFFGWSVAVRATDGLRVAVGSPDVINSGGLVRVYDWSGEFWEEAFKFVSESSFGLLGDSVALSNNGSVLAVGSRGTFGLGRVHVFREMGDRWIEDDDDELLGEQDSEAFGDSVSLSSDGSILAVGAPQNSEFGAGSGMVKVLKYDIGSSTWMQQGTNIGGSSPDANFGVAVSLSANGSRVVAGGPKALFNGGLIEAGSARVYDRDETAQK
jgi:hypothetical protein